MDNLVYEHAGRRIEIALSGRPVSIGRSPEADHQLPSKTASRIHAQALPRDGNWYIEDLGSSNGTFVNGIKIGQPTLLHPGDVVMVADMRLKFEGAAPRPTARPDYLTARLIYTPAPGEPAQEYLIRDKVTIGRKPGNTIVIDNKAISGQNSEVSARDGQYFVRDLASSNGTYVGETQVSERALQNGDVLIVGKAIKIYFIDPASAPAGAAPAPRPAPAPMAAPASGSNRGAMEAVSAMKMAPVQRSPLPALAVGLIVGGLFVLAGWLVGDLVNESRNPKPKAAPAPTGPAPAAPLADAYMSFEGPVDARGNPQGWTASFEAAGKARVELLADTTQPADGMRCLSVTTRDIGGAIGTLILQTEQAHSLDVSGGVTATLHVRGEGVSAASVALALVPETGPVRTLAVARLPDVKASQWTAYTFTGVLLEAPPAGARLRLMLSGNFARLWLDRLEIRKSDAPAPARPFSGTNVAPLALVPGSPGEASLGQLQFAPVLLGADQRALSEPEQWCPVAANAQSVTWRALLPRRGETRALELRAEARPSPFSDEAGLRLSWKIDERAGTSLSVMVNMPLAAESSVVIADRMGGPLVVSRANVHAYPYATISELYVDESGHSLVFPHGAVVWLDFSVPGRLGVALRSAPENLRDGMMIDVFRKPLMMARLYERVFDDGARWMDEKVRNFSAAETRFLWLTDPARVQRDLPVIERARAQLAAIDAQRQALREGVDAAWEAAKADRSAANLSRAEALLRRFLHEFSGDGISQEYRGNLSQVERWQREQAMARLTPDEAAKREAVARALFDDASVKYAAKDLLIALILAENVVRDFPGTLAHREAEALEAEIRGLMTNAAVRDAEIDKRLIEIDQEIRVKRWAIARQMCQDLFKRFPDTPRSRDIMKRLRAIEAAYE